MLYTILLKITCSFYHIFPFSQFFGFGTKFKNKLAGITVPWIGGFEKPPENTVLKLLC